MKKQYLQSQEKFYEDFFGEKCCSEETDITLQEMDEVIDDCQMMLWYSIDRNDKEETSFWRKLLQENKVHRRMLTT